MIDPATFNLLRQFRSGVYQRFDKRADALFELLDAVTVAGLVPSLAYLSLPPVHRRRGAVCMTHWPPATSMLRRCGSWLPAIRWTMGNSSTLWIPASGRATTRRPAQDAPHSGHLSNSRSRLAIVDITGPYHVAPYARPLKVLPKAPIVSTRRSCHVFSRSFAQHPQAKSPGVLCSPASTSRVVRETTHPPTHK
jgi:hypothetical protein